MRKQILIGLSMFIAIPVFADDFEFFHEGQTLPYTIIDEETRTVEVKAGSNAIVGELVIPPCVDYEGTEYTVVSIGENAFREYNELTSVEIPATVRSIGKLAFYGCGGLTKAEFATISQLCAMELDNDYANPLIYAHKLFIDGKEVRNLVIPDSITFINSYVFNGCRELTSIEIPSSVTSIGDYAFKGCIGLTDMDLPDSVTDLGNGAFYGCSGLASIKLPSNITSIGRETFYGCGRLTSICIPDSVGSIGNGAFYYCIGLTSLGIPKTVSTIGGYAFEGCRGLTSVELPESITSISSDTFKACSGLVSIGFPGSLVSIGRGAFNGCRQLTSIVMPDSVRYIGEWAFRNCNNLEEVTLPSRLEVIREEAFRDSKAIRNVKFRGATPFECPEDIFEGNVYEEATLYVGSGLTPMFAEVSPWNLFVNISDTLSDTELSVVKGISVDDKSGNDSSEIMEIYTLQGVRIYGSADNINPGIYVVRKGNKSRLVTNVAF